MSFYAPSPPGSVVYASTPSMSSSSSRGYHSSSLYYPSPMPSQTYYPPPLATSAYHHSAPVQMYTTPTVGYGYAPPAHYRPAYISSSPYVSGGYYPGVPGAPATVIVTKGSKRHRHRHRHRYY
ncbi:hypothetical protein AMATHDRAFT_50458 [Amanita thiersii Skay4041]|uniref:Uncharacterized protein n=1 Tax=Amanita thiersii Skay4041 TaxID=703135 RepID=A0A2A9NHH1_9AGAR|nr:hypothetical protein AMATHDRAFT_50458 [Amanita thiersii Skay4041]